MYLNLPPKTEQTLIAQATAQGMSVEDWATAVLIANAKPSYAKGDFDFDLQRMKQAVGETDENGRAKNTHTVPNWALTDLASFDKWLAV